MERRAEAAGVWERVQQLEAERWMDAAFSSPVKVDEQTFSCVEQTSRDLV